MQENQIQKANEVPESQMEIRTRGSGCSRKPGVECAGLLGRGHMPIFGWFCDFISGLNFAQVEFCGDARLFAALSPAAPAPGIGKQGKIKFLPPESPAGTSYLSSP
jgi:hypothetical protein